MVYDYKYRGLAVIIVNLFKDSPQVRTSAIGDLQKMKDLFLMLDFQVLAYEDRSLEETVKILDDAKNMKFDGHEPECFVCVISSHGDELHNKKKKVWTPVIHTARDNLHIDVDNIVNKFAEGCETYRGKPKLFFIQACRTRKGSDGMRYDPGKKMWVQREGSGDGKGNEDGMGNTIPHSPDSADDLYAFGKGGGMWTFKCDPDLAQFYEKEALKPGEWDATKTDHAKEDGSGENAPKEDGSGENAPKEDGSGENAPKDKSDSKGRTPPVTASTTAGQAPPVTASTTASKMPEVPHDIALIECPKDCLLMFPVSAGRAALRNDSEIGSWMLHMMYRLREPLIQNGQLLQFLTSVSDEIAKLDFEPEELEKSVEKKAKCATFIMHRLTTDVIFHPMSDKSVMAKKRSGL